MGIVYRPGYLSLHSSALARKIPVWLDESGYSVFNRVVGMNEGIASEHQVAKSGIPAIIMYKFFIN